MNHLPNPSSLLPPPSITADGSFIRAVATVHLAVADLVGGEADRGVVGTGVLGGLAGSRLAGFFIRLVLAVNVAVANPALGDALACRAKKKKKDFSTTFYTVIYDYIFNMYAYLILKTFSNVGS